MRLVEVLLRLGCALVAWMVIYTHCIWTATLRVVGCGPDGDHLWRLLLGFVPFTLAFSFLLNASHKLREVHSMMKWLSLGLVLLIPLDLLAIWPWFSQVTLGSAGICAPSPVGNWHVWWAPAQFLVLAVVIFGVYRVWQSDRANSAS